MTVLDSSCVIEFLLGDGVAADVEALLSREGAVAAPDLLVSRSSPSSAVTCSAGRSALHARALRTRTL